jgi:hypothetical protein
MILYFIIKSYLIEIYFYLLKIKIIGGDIYRYDSAVPDG